MDEIVEMVHEVQETQRKCNILKKRTHRIITALTALVGAVVGLVLLL